MKSSALVLLALAYILFLAPAPGDEYIIRDGQSQAEIIIATNPPRMVKLAAEELRGHIKKISGAELAITNKPSGKYPVSVYVGKSAYTDKLGVMARPGSPQAGDGLQYGAFRMKSGPDYLILLGHDFDFAPREPCASGSKDKNQVLAEWDKLTALRTDTAWGNPMGGISRAFNMATGTCTHDEGGSLNAVYEFLRGLGMRWYMPGELGEVVPEMKTIKLPAVDRLVRPSYPLRYFVGPAYANAPREAVLWGRRLRLNYGYELLGAGQKTHGLSNVHARREMQEKHPEYYALIGGKRDVKTRGTGHVCFSSEGLQREAANYARAVFDIYNEPTLQLSPQDGLRMCQCEKCKDLMPSDAVWGFLDRVAREVYKTHPDRLLIGAAYTSYREPPENITRLSTNIAVRINNVGRPTLDVPGRWEWYQGLITGWQAKVTSAKIIRVENNLYSTVIHPHMMARDLQAMRGISLGEMNEVSREKAAGGQGQTWGKPGLNHLTLYVNAAFLWDADQDLDALLDEYYRLFYGPAKKEMRAAFEYAEANYSREGRACMELPGRIRFVELLHAARTAAGETIYGKRVQLILDELDPLEKLRAMHAINTQRTNAPAFSSWNLDNSKWNEAWKESRVDGRLDEPFWGNRKQLQNQAGGGKPKFETRFSILPGRKAVCVGIMCRGMTNQPLNVSTTNNGDPAILQGDHVEFLLETDANAYYRIVVNPAGARLEMDMAEDGVGAAWSSNAEIAVDRGGDYWSVEMRIPVVPEDEGAGDPNHYVLYRRMPSELWPWHFNIARVRVRGGEAETAVFVPTGEKGLQDRLKFARLVGK